MNKIGKMYSNPCSPEEIERKKLEAQQRRAERLQSRPSNSAQSDSNKNGFGVKRKFDSTPLSVIPPKQVKVVNTIQPSNFFGRKDKIKAECRMITESRFEIYVLYHQELIEFFKTIPSRAYEQKTKLWNFHIDDYQKTISGIRSKFHGEIEVKEIPQIVLQSFKRKLNKVSKSVEPDLSRIDPVLRSKLMPFQREGILFAIEKNGRCMIADDMGLGKTLQALGVAHYYRDSWPLLIVTPSSVRYQWSETIYKFLPSVPYQHVLHFSSGKDCLADEKITIVSYDLMSRNIAKFQRKTFGFVIFDECHALKNHKAARTEAAKRIVSTARHILLLSGTPALSRPIELFSQISLINRNFMHLREYGLRYCEGKDGKFGVDYKGVSNTQELQLLLKSSFLIRRLKSEVLKQLPEKIRQVVMLDPGLIEAATKEMKKMAENLTGKMLEGFEKHAELMRYYSQSSRQRLKAVGSYVEDLVEQNKKFLIFAHHKCVLDEISNVLDKLHVKYMRIDGETSSSRRQDNIDYFQKTEDCLVAVLSITAANAGITLTAASLVVFAELYWNPAELSQAEDRVHRIGQRNCVIIQYLIAKGTIDDVMWPMLQTKTHFLREAGLDQNFSLSQADVLEQPAEASSSTEEMKQETLESFGFSQSISGSQDDEYMTPMETFPEPENRNSSLNNGACNGNTEKTGNTDDDDFAKMLDDDADDFENMDLDGII